MSSGRGVWQLELVLGAIAISFSAVFVRLVHVSPTVSGFYRMLFGGLILLGIMVFRRERLQLGVRNFLFLALAAACFAADLMLWHRSILYVGPGLATLLANFQVFVLAAVGVLFLKERLTLLQCFSIGLAMLGLGLLVGSGWGHLPPLYHRGVVLGLFTAGAYAGYILTLRNIRTTGKPGSAFATITVVSLITALILATAVGVEGDSFAIPSWSDAGWLLLYGLVPQVLGWVLISTSMAKVGAAQVGLVLLLQPTGSLIWDWLFFGRRFTAIEIVGAVIALAAIYMGSMKSKTAAKAVG
ncbi:MAG TPA: DMT family transporter [Gammaproteobacteria bacterium]|nr:DMT family transporter [Gammaproteobacteria bacterium]